MVGRFSLVRGLMLLGALPHASTAAAQEGGGRTRERPRTEERPARERPARAEPREERPRREEPAQAAPREEPRRTQPAERPAPQPRSTGEPELRRRRP